MAGVFTRSSKRFSIDDAFEEEKDEVIKIYGSTTERSPLKPKNRSITSDESIVNQINDPIHYSQSTRLSFPDDTLSRDSDSLIHDSGYHTSFFDPSQYCWHHPKIRENWKTVLAAVNLLIVGIGLLLLSLFVLSMPDTGLQGFVFFIAGCICFIPGAYHVVYIYLAVKGKQGYDFYHLPLFN